MPYQIKYTNVLPSKVIPVSSKIKSLCENLKFFVKRLGDCLKKTVYLPIFTHFYGIVSARWDILRKKYFM